MIFALDRGVFLKIIVSLVVGIVALIGLMGSGISSSAIWATRGTIGTVVGLIVLVLCIPSFFRFLHRITFAKLWMFPLLDGEWDAVICSNWPRIRRTYEAARGAAPHFNALSDDLTPEEEAECLTRVRVTIESTLLTISIKVQPNGTERVSRTIFVRPVWRRPALPELTYVYEQADPLPVPATDTKRHFGAGVLTYDRDSDVISGEYWTQRKDEAGFNTAGTITMQRSGATI